MFVYILLFLILLTATIFLYYSTYSYETIREKAISRLLNYEKQSFLKKIYDELISNKDKTLLHRYGVSDYNPIVIIYNYRIYISLLFFFFFLIIFNPIISFIIFVLFFILPLMLMRHTNTKLMKDLIDKTPAVMEVIAIYMQAGMNFEKAVVSTSEVVGPISRAWEYQLILLTQNISIYAVYDSLMMFNDTFDRHPVLSRLCHSIATALNTGQPFVPILLKQAKQVRQFLVMQTEEKIASLGTKLTVPMILFFLMPVPLMLIFLILLKNFFPNYFT